MRKEISCLNCEAYLSKFLNSMSEGFAIHEIICDTKGNPVDYRFLEANPAFEKITGLKNEEIIGNTVTSVLPGIDRFWIETYGRTALTGEPVQFEHYSADLQKYFRVSAFSPMAGQFITLFTDITELRNVEEVLKKHQVLFEYAQDIVLYVKTDGKLVDANKKAVEKYGYSREELLRMSILDIRHPSTEVYFEEQMREADIHGIVFEGIHVRKDGTTFPVEVSARSTQIGNERLRIHIIRDITERKKAQEKILYLANYDSLTGIPNRGNIMQQLDMALEHARRDKNKFALMLFDIDRFKSINDTYGHPAGDKVLKTVAARVQGAIRKVDAVGRIGGDEFIAILPAVHKRENITELMRRIFKVIEEPVKIGTVDLTVSISAGISLYPEDTENLKDLMLYADQAMYAAKQQSGSSYHFWPAASEEVYEPCLPATTEI